MSWNNVKSSVQNSIKQNGSGAITGNLLQGVLLTICNEAALGLGPQGKSAYQVWLDEGNVGTVSDFFASLKGAKGDHVSLRKTTTGIEWKLSSQPDTAYQLLVTIDELKLHFSDLTAANIALLQQPATDAADSLTIYVQQKDQELTQLQQDTESARQNAITATTNAESATTYATNVAGAASRAATDAANATTDANTAASTANQAATDANAAKDAANTAATSANNAADAANAATTAADLATQSATTASDKAEELNINQPKIITGEWWAYDPAAHGYINTGLPARGPGGKGPVVLVNGNYGNWDEATQTYSDTGIVAAATINLEDFPVSFIEAATRDNIQTGETVPTVFGKLRKWFNDLGTLAWKNKVDYTADIDNLPDLASTVFVNDAISNHNAGSTSHSDIREELTNLANASLFENVAQLPASGEANKIYVIPNPASEDEENKYVEYYWNANESKWEMLGGAGGGSESGGITNPNYEIVTVSPQSNPVNIEHEFIGNVEVEVSWDGAVQKQWTFDGSPMTLFVPKDKEYTIKVSELDWFSTPEPLVYTAAGGNTRTASPTYTCAEINVGFWDYSRQLSPDFFSLMNGAVLTVKLNGKEKEIFCQGYNNPSVLYAPIGSNLEFMGTETMSTIFVPVQRTLHVTEDKMSFSYQYENGGVSINGYSNNELFAFSYSIFDAVSSEALYTDVQSFSNRNKLTPLNVGRNVIVKFGSVAGYKTPNDIQITVPLGSDYVNAHYRGAYLQIRKNLLKEVVATIYNTTYNTVCNTITIPAAYSSNQSMNVPVRNDLNYRVEFSDVSGYETPSPITGTVVEEYTSIIANYGGSVFRLYNSNSLMIHAKLYNTDTNEVYFDNDIPQWNTTEVLIPTGVSYRLLATYGAENILEESGVSASGSKQVTIQKRIYSLNLHNPYNFGIVYVLTNLDSNISTEYDVAANSPAAGMPATGSSIKVDLPIGTNYKVELSAYEDFGLPAPYIGVAEVPAGNTTYTHGLSLSYKATNLQISSYMSYVDPQPERTFTVINRDTNEVYKTVLMPSGSGSTSVLLPFNFNFEVRASDVRGFSAPSPYTGNTGTHTSLNANMQYTYFIVNGSNHNRFPINVHIMDADALLVLHDFVIGSYNNSYNYSIKPGTNYMIHFGPVEGYQMPAPITGIATINGQRYLSPSDTIYTAV